MKKKKPIKKTKKKPVKKKEPPYLVDLLRQIENMKAVIDNYKDNDTHIRNDARGTLEKLRREEQKVKILKEMLRNIRTLTLTTLGDLANLGEQQCGELVTS